jgi:hydroxybutyrate-dimer hydrolase
LALRIDVGVAEILSSGRLHGIPATIVTGRNDGILPPNFASRAYYGLNKTLESANSSLHYYEVLNASHLDSFNQFPGYNANYVPLHRYYLQALDLMYSHLKNKTDLPPSQVVRTAPRGTTGTAANPISLANVPPISQAPASGDLIQFTPGKVYIPD